MELEKEILYQLTDIHFVYRRMGHANTVVFDGLSLSVRKEEAYVVLSPGGAGKSSLLRMMAGLLRPDQGNILFEGRCLLGESREEQRTIRRRIGMTFERGGLFDSLTCLENLELGLRERGELSSAEIRIKSRQMLSEVGLSGTEALLPHEISGGMKKRLGIARALVLAPEVILYDEPTAGLDPITARTIIELMLTTMKRHSITSVVVTSDFALANQMAEKIGFLYRGRILEVGKPNEIRESENPIIRQFVRGLLDGPLTNGQVLK